MGKVEKLIVLSVLFVVAVILVVSLTMDDPLKKDRVTMAPASGVGDPASLIKKSDGPAAPAAIAPTTTPAPAVAAVPEPAKSKALLSSNVQPTPSTPVAEEKPAAQGMSLPAASILKTTEGLQDSYLPEMKFYTWQAGDNFRTVAFKYYGDYAKLTILRRANEGRQDVQAGEKILVPVFDFDAVASSAAPDPVVASSMKSAPASASTAAPVASTPVASTKSGGPRTHVVKEGESLWKIAKQELGAGSRWNEIYEANCDVLATPEALHTGQRLRIP